jgi:hypothetical protein
MSNLQPSRRFTGLISMAFVAVLAAACGSATATPSAGSTGATDGASASPTPSEVPTATATPTAAAATSAPAATPTPAPVATPAPRLAWSRGQTVKQDVLVAPGVGWVLTNRGLWQTLNDGSTWVNAYPHGLLASSTRGLGAFDANHALLAAVNVGHSTSTYYLWHTSDAGRSWAYTALPPITHDIPCTGCLSQAGDPAASFDYVNASTAFVWIGMKSGIDGQANYIFETTNGGTTWAARSYDATLVASGPTASDRVQFSTPSTGVVESGNEISSTTTGWGHWTNRLLATDAYNTPAISFLSSTYWAADEGLEYATVHYTYALSSDQGATWTDHQTNVPGIAHVTGATVRFITPLIWIGTEQTSDSSGLTTGPATTIYTVDGGVHWAMYGLQPFNGSVPTFIDANHGWAGPNYQVATHKLYRTSDRGLTWHLITP